MATAFAMPLPPIDNKRLTPHLMANGGYLAGLPFKLRSDLRFFHNENAVIVAIDFWSYPYPP